MKQNEKFYEVGTRVTKKSGKPFKSLFKTNTIKGVIEHPYKKRNGEPVMAYTFYEDDSIVECSICVEA